jgi:hypothetical protein
MSKALMVALGRRVFEEAGEGGGSGGAGGSGGDAGGDKGGEGSGERTVEDRARAMGWSPKEEFRGDQSRWVDAATFVKNGEESLPILRERMRKLEATNMELTKGVREAREFNDKVYEKALAQARKEAKEEITRATKAGDANAATAAAESLAATEREAAEHKAKKEAEGDPVFESWQKDNADWYQDPDMRVEAEAIAFKLRKKGDKSEGLPFLDKVKDEMKKAFPDRFSNPRRNQPGSVERTGGGGEGGSRSKKGWDALPTEAKQAGDRFIKQKLVKDRETYAKQYFEQET